MTGSSQDPELWKRILREDGNEGGDDEDITAGEEGGSDPP